MILDNLKNRNVNTLVFNLEINKVFNLLFCFRFEMLEKK